MTAIEPVRRGVRIGVPVERAFAVFTERISEWWPVATHSRSAMEETGPPRAVGALIEPRAGGRMVELRADGSEAPWGTVSVWDPPHRVTIAWRPNDEDHEPTEVDVTFTPDGDGTRVELVHSGWERLGAVRGREARESYDTGWETVIADFAAHAGTAAAAGAR
jgi:uncharacterized protein YndB with AHSA1/START domain